MVRRFFDESVEEELSCVYSGKGNPPDARARRV
jgi:hypothetical protein